MIEQLIKKLEVNGILDDTYVFFTTDNGFHISQHRMHPGKECGYDTDIRVPLIIRGPGIAKGKALDLVSSHTDIAPTILSIAGATRDSFDGLPIPLTLDGSTKPRGEHVNVEFWGVGLPEGKYGVEIQDYPNNTYKALRLVGDGYSLYYSVWCTGEREYYDLKVRKISHTHRGACMLIMLAIIRRTQHKFTTTLRTLLSRAVTNSLVDHSVLLYTGSMHFSLSSRIVREEHALIRGKFIMEIH